MRSGFGQFCPVAVACEVFAERWTPLILREMFAGSMHFNDIRRGVPLISSALLAQRLRSLEARGVIVRESAAQGRSSSYRLTDAGREFKPVIEGLGAWGQRWTVRVSRDTLDPGFLMWNMHRRIDLARLPDGRTVLRFDYSGVPARCRGPRQFWLLLDRHSCGICVEDPGLEVDLCIDADLATMTSVWLGDMPLADALRSRKVRLLGPRTLVREFPAWLMLSRFADIPRPASRAPGP